MNVTVPILGTHKLVLLWSFLNYLGLSCEAVARAVARHPLYKNYEHGGWIITKSGYYWGGGGQKN